jgi:hypothetical protein
VSLKIFGPCSRPYLAEDSTVAQRDVHLTSVVCNNVQLAAFDDVHLLSNVAFAADVITGREYLIKDDI